MEEDTTVENQATPIEDTTVENQAPQIEDTIVENPATPMIEDTPVENPATPIEDTTDTLQQFRDLMAAPPAKRIKADSRATTVSPVSPRSSVRLAMQVQSALGGSELNVDLVRMQQRGDVNITIVETPPGLPSDYVAEGRKIT